MFPFYLSIGMSYEQYWEQDVELAKYYREAWKLKREVREQELWLQGAYVYEAICDAAPILHAFSKKGATPTPYRDRPFGVYSRVKNSSREELENRSDNKAKSIMEMMMISINQKFEKKGGDSDGR